MCAVEAALHGEQLPLQAGARGVQLGGGGGASVTCDEVGGGGGGPEEGLAEEGEEGATG